MEIRTSTNLRFIVSDESPLLQYIHYIYIIYIYAYIKQWRFELRTPLPKRGAQPLGHLPDKFEK